MNIEQLVRPNILQMKAYSSARDEYNALGEVTLLDANENPFDTGYNRYPDPYQKRLKEQIGQIKGIGADQIFLGNGSDEAIDLIFRIFCQPGQDNIIIPDPTYGMYEVSAAIQDVEVKKVPLSSNFELQPDQLLEAADEHSKVMFICNPNNPSGNLLSSTAIKKVMSNFKGVVVIDEAYIDFTPANSMITEIADNNRLIILQTLSKAWGLAGLRLGMAFASTDIIALLNKVKAPYNLSVLTQKTVSVMLENARGMKSKTNNLINERVMVEAELNKLALVEQVYPSDTNFLLVKFSDHNKVFQHLKNEGIIVRDRSRALHCERCLRLTVGTPEENLRLINALKNL